MSSNGFSTGARITVARNLIFSSPRAFSFSLADMSSCSSRCAFKKNRDKDVIGPLLILIRVGAATLF